MAGGARQAGSEGTRRAKAGGVGRSGESTESRGW